MVDKKYIQAIFATILVLIALSPASKTIANYCAFLVFLSAIFILVKEKKIYAHDNASKFWFCACGISFVLLVLVAAFWGDRYVYALRVGRILPSACAAWIISAYYRGSKPGVRLVTYAVACACVVSFGVSFHFGRETPTNPIPWAVSIGFFVAILLPRAIEESTVFVDKCLWSLATIAGLVGMFLSLSRGSYWIYIWTVVTLLFFARKGKLIKSPALFFVVVSLTILGFMSGFGHFSGKSVDRMKLAQKEFVDSIKDPNALANIDTSVGGRIYLWKIAVNEFNSSPLIGVGNKGLTNAIQNEAERLNSSGLRYAGDQIHNEILQMAASYGLWGIGASLLICVGLLMTSLRVSASDRVTRWQLWGILFMHVMGGLTNVNFSQNYYGIMLGLSVGVVLLFREREPVARDVALRDL